MTDCKFSLTQMPAQRDQLIRDLLTHPGSMNRNLNTVLYPEPLKPPRQE